MRNLFLLVTLAGVAQAAPAPAQILKAVNNPASFKPEAVETSKTDSGVPIKVASWSKDSVRVETVIGNSKAWLWKSSADDVKLSAFGPVKKIVAFDSGMTGGITLTGYQITGGGLKGNYVQVINFGGGDISTSVFSDAYTVAWAKGPDAMSGFREIRGYFPVYLYKRAKATLCSRPDYTCF